MRDDIYHLLSVALDSSQCAKVEICKLERIAGDDWLLEVSQQAMQLKAHILPHPTKPEMLIVKLDL